MTIIISTTDTRFAVVTCITCGVKSAMPEELNAQLQRIKASYYCPNGHTQYYLGKTPEQERDEARSKVRRLEDEVEAQARKVKRLKGKLKRAEA